MLANTMVGLFVCGFSMAVGIGSARQLVKSMKNNETAKSEISSSATEGSERFASAYAMICSVPGFAMGLAILAGFIEIDWL